MIQILGIIILSLLAMNVAGNIDVGDVSLMHQKIFKRLLYQQNFNSIFISLLSRTKESLTKGVNALVHKFQTAFTLW